MVAAASFGGRGLLKGKRQTTAEVDIASRKEVVRGTH